MKKLEKKQANVDKAAEADTEAGRAKYGKAVEVRDKGRAKVEADQEILKNKIEKARKKADIKKKECEKLESAQVILDQKKKELKAREDSCSACRNLLSVLGAKACGEDSPSKGEAAQSKTDNHYTPVRGTFVLRTDRMDLSAKNVYAAYAQRPRTEEFFRLYDSILGFDSSYMQDDAGVDGWFFLNHISASIAVEALHEISRAGITDVSYADLIETLGSMRACLDPGTEEWVMYPADRKAEELCRQLGCDPKEFLPGGPASCVGEAETGKSAAAAGDPVSGGPGTSAT